MPEPVTFIVTHINLADTPVGGRRGVLTIDHGRVPPRWQVVVYDPRPDAFDRSAGLELPFSCRGPEGVHLTGWVSVGAADPEVGVQCLRGLGRLRARPLWHVARRGRRHAAGDWQTGPSYALDMPDVAATAAAASASGTDEPVGTTGRTGAGGRSAAYATPRLLRRLGTRRALLAAAALTLCAWGLLSLALDIGAGVRDPVQASATATGRLPAAAQGLQAAPVLSMRVAVVERLGSPHGWVGLRDTLGVRVLRTNGVTELHALLPGPGCVPATDRGGRCDLVLRDLFGERHRYRAVVRHRRLDEHGATYIAGVLAGPH